MNKSVLEIFEEIAQIPHPSFETQRLFEYICEFSKKCGYEVQSDEAKNIYACTKKSPRICFQSHYDMVAVGEAYKPLELYKEKGFLRAKKSSLGADNGIGVASQLYLMQKYQDLEFLFTNNEEVGLLGAKGLELNIASNRLINLDSEVFGEIVLGCAGGYDMSVVFDLAQDSTDYKYTYNITSRGFQGGHSGIDIHKGIKSAIICLVEFISRFEGGIAEFRAGEKINSIPVNAQVIFKTDEILQTSEDFLVESICFKQEVYKKDPLVSFVLGAKSGVRAKDNQDVIDSCNISLLSQTASEAKISLMGRANTKRLLEDNLLEMKHLARSIDSNARVQEDDFYPPWQRNIKDDDEFLDIVKKAFGSHQIQISQIHAGLECGILQERLEAMGKKNLKIVSIGPSILFPHSLNECLELNSFDKFFGVLENLTENYKI